MSGEAFEELEWRGLVADYTRDLPELLEREKVTAYVGFDPTSDSLQVGNLLPLMGLARLQRFGHTPIALAGGGTGMIGDPSGKAQERQLMSYEQVQANVGQVRKQLARLLDFEVKSNPAQIQNNADWLMSIPMMDFLRDVGKHFTVNYMVSKDSVKNRLESEEGISYTEFSYMLLQAYDFLYLYDLCGCRLQAGGSDQWGNITAGIELIRRVRGERAYGLVYPLVVGADGAKLGKTAHGAVYLSAERTSPYRFYQFWFNQDDADVIKYLRYYTWLTREEIDDLADQLAAHAERREAQRTLAREVTRIVHGEDALARAELASQVLFGGELSGLGASDIEEIFADVPSTDVPRTRLEGEGLPLVDLLTDTGISRSKGQARRLIENGGAYVNNRRIEGVDAVAGTSDTIDGRFIVLRQGKKTYHLVRVR